jgi:ParB-like nuclease family protein
MLTPNASTTDQQYPMAQRIEFWPIEKLIPFARNPRTHSDSQVAQIAASIESFGFNNPILVDTKAGIIAGHGRLFAEQIVTKRDQCQVDHPSPKQADPAKLSVDHQSCRQGRQ